MKKANPERYVQYNNAIYSIYIPVSLQTALGEVVREYKIIQFFNFIRMF